MAQSDIKTKFHWDAHDETAHIARTQDCDPYLERAHALREVPQDPEMRLTAVFPFVIVEQYCNTHGIDFSEWCRNPEHVERMLADRALSGFRVWEGKP